MRRILTDLGYGTILAAAAAGLSCLVALLGFGRPYYLSVLFPLVMLAYLLVAWVLYLRDDRFMRSPSAMRRRPPADTGRPHETLLSTAARWDEEPIRRTDVPGDKSFPRAKHALVWAAAELAAAATVLYVIWGVGATYHG